MQIRSLFPIVALAAMLPPSAAQAESQRFAEGVSLGDSLLEVKVADALYRRDGRWLTLGSRVDSDTRETPYLLLRTAGGDAVASVALAPDDGLSWSPRSIVPAGNGNDVIVLGIEYDHRDFGALSTLFLARLDANLGVVWSRHLDAPGLWFESPALRERAGASPMLVAQMQHNDGGQLDAGDAFLADVDVDTGALISPRSLGTATGLERAADAITLDGDARAVLVETRRDNGAGLESADAIVTFDANGAMVSNRLVGHAPVVGVRAQSLRLMRDGDSFVLAGRRTSLGPNFFYLHRLAADFTPAASRTLIPFFNAMDMTVRDGSVLLYGEANGEVMDRGSVLMRLDADFAIALQRRYGTENQTFPTGALALGDNGILLALGAMRDEDGFVYESTFRVLPATGEGMLCEEEAYEGFSTGSDATTTAASWSPTLATLDVQTTDTAASASSPTRGDALICSAEDELVFRHDFETES